jgi:hypothetical protein
MDSQSPDPSSIPDPTLPRYPNIPARPFEIEIETREFPAASSELPPFKIVVGVESDELRLYVNKGRITTFGFTSGSSNNKPCAIDIAVDFEPVTSDLLNDDFGFSGIVGYSVLSPSTTYGVWVVVAQMFGSYLPVSDFKNFEQIHEWSADNAGSIRGEIYVTSAAGETEFGDGRAVTTAFNATYDAPCAFYLGKVEVDANGSATIKQWRTSDIFSQMTALPDEFIIVSGDADNSITPGSDGGAYYDAP